MKHDRAEIKFRTIRSRIRNDLFQLLVSAVVLIEVLAIDYYYLVVAIIPIIILVEIFPFVHSIHVKTQEYIQITFALFAAATAPARETPRVSARANLRHGRDAGLVARDALL